MISNSGYEHLEGRKGQSAENMWNSILRMSWGWSQKNSEQAETDIKCPFWDKRKAWDQAETANVGGTDLRLRAFMLEIFSVVTTLLSEKVCYIIKSDLKHIHVKRQVFAVKSTTLSESCASFHTHPPKGPTSKHQQTRRMAGATQNLRVRSGAEVCLSPLDPS